MYACVLFSTKSGDKLASLDQYISRMKPNQKDIYYITGSNKEQLEKSPFLEQLKKKGYEVFVCVEGRIVIFLIRSLLKRNCYLSLVTGNLLH